MNFIALVSLALLMGSPLLHGAQGGEKSIQAREQEAKEASLLRNLQAQFEEEEVAHSVPKEKVPAKYPQTQLRLKDLQAKIERLGQEAITPKEREALIAQGKDIESEIRKAGLKQLSEDERDLYDILLFGELAEVFGEARGIQGTICSYLTGWHEVGQFKGHLGVVNALEIDQDLFNHYKDILISGGQDGTVKIWAIDTQTCKYTLPADPHPVTALKMIVTVPRTLAVAYGSYIKLFTMQKNKAPTLTKIFTGYPSSITTLDSYYSENNEPKLLAYNAEDILIRTWNIKTGQFTDGGHPHDPRPWPATRYNIFTFNPATDIAQSIAVPEHTATTFSNYISLRYSYQKQESSQYLFASGDAQGNIYIWDTANPSCITKLEGHTAKITSLAMTHKNVHIKKLRSPAFPCSCPCAGCKSTYEEESPGKFCILSFEGHCKSCMEKYEKAEQEAPNTVQLVSASEDGTMRLWEMSEGTKKLPALVEQGKKIAEDPRYLSEDEDYSCACYGCEEDEKESSAALRRRIKEEHGS